MGETSIRQTSWRRDLIGLWLLALLVGIGLILVLDEPGYADAYYYYNAGERLASGKGLTDPYLWTYLNAPDDLPVPSHTYWMPMSSLAVALSMAILGTGFNAAQLPFVLALSGMVVLGGWLGGYLGDARRHVWVSGLLVLFGGLFFPFWATTDSFSLFGLFGGGALVALGLGRKLRNWRWYALAGLLSGLGHLTRADGLLLVLVVLLLALWPYHEKEKGQSFHRWSVAGAIVLAYLVVMAPWFMRNMDVMGSPLPAGGVGTAFLRDYNEIFEYPVDWSATEFVDWGVGNILESRWEAFTVNLGTFIGVEGWVILMPFSLVALWRRRGASLLSGFMLYALALHLVMTLVFAFPGYRGGLFHSAAALVPFWAALSVLGIDDVTEWAGKRFRRRRIGQDKIVFSGFAVLIALGVAMFALFGRGGEEADVPSIDERAAIVEEDLVTYEPMVMVNDPAGWYYHTGQSGVTLPDAPLARIPEIAGRYCVTHLVLDANITESFRPMMEDDLLPPYLVQIAHLNSDTETLDDDVRVYRFKSESIDYAENCPIPETD